MTESRQEVFRRFASMTKQLVRVAKEMDEALDENSVQETLLDVSSQMEAFDLAILVVVVTSSIIVLLVLFFVWSQLSKVRGVEIVTLKRVD